MGHMIKWDDTPMKSLWNTKTCKMAMLRWNMSQLTNEHIILRIPMNIRYSGDLIIYQFLLCAKLNEVRAMYEYDTLFYSEIGPLPILFNEIHGNCWCWWCQRSACMNTFQSVRGLFLHRLFSILKSHRIWVLIEWNQFCEVIGELFRNLGRVG